MKTTRVLDLLSKKLNQETHFPLFTTMFTSQLPKEAELKNAQPCKATENANLQ